MEFYVKGSTFSVEPVYSEGHLPTHAEAQALNSFLTKKLRELVLDGNITSRSEAEIWLFSDEALTGEEFFEQLTNLDELL